MTAGTNTPETLSAIFAIGALVADASFTIRTICAKDVSSPTLVALHFNNPVRLMVAVNKMSPTFLSTGMLSPVMEDSSTAELPSMTSPSAGMRSPGRTKKISPTAINSAGIIISFPFLTTHALSGAIFARLFNASVVRPLE